MTRLLIMTVGKTHSGKTTFANMLEKELKNSVVIDQDNHAEFINTCYKSLVPQQGPNTLKYAISQTIVDYSLEESSFHLIVCNSNLSKSGRMQRIKQYKEKGLNSILVHFDIPDCILQSRVKHSDRSTAIFRIATTFEEVLERQQREAFKEDDSIPDEGEADHLFVIRDSEEIQWVIREIVGISQSK
jgi:tRNA uridine 5-carbamoylmethylation protein Kti12